MDSMVQGVVVFSPFSFTLHAFTRHQERHRSSLSGSLKLSLCDRERPEPASGIFISSFFQVPEQHQIEPSCFTHKPTKTTL